MEYSPQYIRRKEQQFLVHSFLYYKMNESLIDDTAYDSICKELYKFKNHECLKFPQLVKGLDESGSGFYIKKYPDSIMTTALHLLHRNIQKNSAYKESFLLFITRKGFHIKQIGRGK